MTEKIRNIDCNLMEQELFILPEHLSSSLVLSRDCVTRSLTLCVCFVDRCLSLCTFSFGHCVSVLLHFMDSDYPFGIFKPSFKYGIPVSLLVQRCFQYVAGNLFFLYCLIHVGSKENEYDLLFIGWMILALCWSSCCPRFCSFAFVYLLFVLLLCVHTDCPFAFMFLGKKV